jgi:hypothetical protein
LSDAEDRIPCPHPIEFRGSADCHLCGNSGFVLPGSPWLPLPLATGPAALERDHGGPGRDTPLGASRIAG